MKDITLTLRKLKTRAKKLDNPEAASEAGGWLYLDSNNKWCEDATVNCRKLVRRLSHVLKKMCVVRRVGALLQAFNHHSSLFFKNGCSLLAGAAVPSRDRPERGGDGDPMAQATAARARAMAKTAREAAAHGLDRPCGH